MDASQFDWNTMIINQTVISKKVEMITALMEDIFSSQTPVQIDLGIGNDWMNMSSYMHTLESFGQKLATLGSPDQ